MDLLLANPRGFCAGVDRAIEIVERALALHGAPIYVRHEVVHNKFVVDGLRQKGAIFIEDLADVPSGSILIFSAHGVSQAVRHEAEARGLTVFDATCPLVTKVHIEVSRMREQGKEIIMIGHAGHPEVEGTMGQRSNGGMYLVESPEQVAASQGERREESRLRHANHAVCGRCQHDHRRAQDTLPVYHRPEERRHLLCHAEPPGRGEDAGQTMRCGGRGGFAEQLEFQPPARSRGECRRAGLSGERCRVNCRPEWFAGKAHVGISAGASAPEVLVQGVIARLQQMGGEKVIELQGIVENVVFPLPKTLIPIVAQS